MQSNWSHYNFDCENGCDNVWSQRYANLESSSKEHFVRLDTMLRCLLSAVVKIFTPEYLQFSRAHFQSCKTQYFYLAATALHQNCFILCGITYKS